MGDNMSKGSAFSGVSDVPGDEDEGGDDDSPMFFPRARRFMRKIRRQFPQSISSAEDIEDDDEGALKRVNEKGDKNEISSEEEEEESPEKGDNISKKHKTMFPITQSIVNKVVEKFVDIEKIKDDMSKDGMKLETLSEKLRDNEKVVLEAVKNNGKALQFASERIKSDGNTVIEAIKNDPYSLEFAGKDLQEEENIVMLALDRNKKVLEIVLPKFSKDENFLLKLITEVYEGTGESIFPLLDDEMKSNDDFVKRLVKADPMIFKYLSEEQKNDRDIAIIAVTHNCYLLKDVGDKLLKDDKFKFLLLAISRNIDVIDQLHKIGDVYDHLRVSMEKDEDMKTKYSHGIVSGCTLGLARLSKNRASRKSGGGKKTRLEDILDMEFDMQKCYILRGFAYTFLKQWRISVEDFMLAVCLNKKFRHSSEDYKKVGRRIRKCFKTYLVSEFDKNWTNFELVKTELDTKKTEKEVEEFMAKLFATEFRGYLYRIFIEEPFVSSRKCTSDENITDLQEFELELYEGRDIEPVEEQEGEMDDDYDEHTVKDPRIEIRKIFAECCIPCGSKPPYNQPLISFKHEKGSNGAIIGRLNMYNNEKPRNGYYVVMNVVKGGFLFTTKYFYRRFVGKFAYNGMKDGNGVLYDTKDPKKVEFHGVWSSNKLVKKK